VKLGGAPALLSGTVFGHTADTVAALPELGRSVGERRVPAPLDRDLSQPL